MKPIALLIICAILTSIGQLIMKRGLPETGPIEVSPEFFKIFLNRFVSISIIFCLGGWVFYLVALSKAELSYAYPIWSLSYVIVPIVSLIIFKEQLSLMRAGGLTFLTLGIILIAIS